MANLLNVALFNVSLLVTLLPSAMPPAAAADTKTEGLTGFWVLDTEKSRWGQMQKPTSVMLDISHSDGRVRYTGQVAYASEDTREFTFDGVVGGKEYPVERSYGKGRQSIIQKDANTYQTEFKSDDGLYIETSQLVLSKDRNVLTRQMSLKSPVGPRSWVEIYRRR